MDGTSLAVVFNDSNMIYFENVVVCSVQGGSLNIVCETGKDDMDFFFPLYDIKTWVPIKDKSRLLFNEDCECIGYLVEKYFDEEKK